MTSFYNPSKKVTELLSQYLDFDPEQLQLGNIWSGNVTLRNVSVRQQPITPYLQGLRLVSGTIGSLSMQIPWKSLVWGQGDVQVDVRNIVLTLALESSSSSTAATSAEQHQPTDSRDDPEAIPSSQQLAFPRDKKQKLVRDAEKRLHQRRRLLGPWLQAVKRKQQQQQDEEDRQKNNNSSNKTPGAMVKWFKSMSSDFVWRFCVGLQLRVENVKILLVQDGVEIGLLIPSCTVIPTTMTAVDENAAGVNNATVVVVPSSQPNPQGAAAADDNDEDEDDSRCSSAGTTQTMTDHNTADGEHVDKQFKLMGIGLYVRPRADGDDHVADIYTSDYVIRPVDVALDGSLFVPAPAEKRKKKQKNGADDATTVVGTDTGVSLSEPQLPLTVQSIESSSGTLRRRGKREKQEDVATELTVPTTRASSDANLPYAPASPRRVRVGSMHHRRFSTGVTRATSAPALPLAQPDDIGATYSSRTRSFGQDKRTAKLDGKLHVGAVQLVCSATQYRLLHVFLASSAKVRKGRPATTIRDALLLQRNQHESLSHRSASFLLLDNGDDSSAQVHNQASFSSSLTAFQQRPTKSLIVRSWWHYVLHAVDTELQQRKRLRHVFSQKFLSFNWTAQHYKRKEYVTLYIAFYLDKKQTKDKLRQQMKEEQERLFTLEDTLPVEQILLYRSIARAVHVRGGRKMPPSILALQRSSTTESQPVKSPAGAGYTPPEEQVGFLAALTSRCEVARARLHQEIGQDMPQFPSPADEGLINMEGDPVLLYDEYDDEEGSYDLDISESKTVRTHRSNHTTGFSVAATALDSANLHEMLETGILFAFVMKVQKLELMIVGDETKHHGYGGPGGLMETAAQKNDPFACDTLSVLTDDHRFEHIEESSTAVVDESENSGRIFPSSDFLLFQMPEKVILRLVVSNLACVAMGQSGGSRNLNFTVARVHVTGENNVSLLAMGSESSRPDLPLDEIKLSTNDFDTFVGASCSPNNALTLSVVGRALTHFIQCDTPLMEAELHVKTIENLLVFVKRTGATYPRPLLPRSPREDLRLYILQQNQMLFTGLNCSVRVHGCNITVPLTPKQDRSAGMDVSARSTTTTTDPVAKDCLVLRCDMIEMYSGDAVEDISTSMQNEPPMHSLLAPATMFVKTESVATRRLSMLDVPGILVSNDSSLASHWVFTMSGIDMNFSINETMRETMFQLPLEVELLYSLNGDSLLDSNRARHEVVMELSPLTLSLSPSDFLLLNKFSRTLQDLHLLVAAESAQGELPRLEVLSKFMRLSIDLSVKHFRLVLRYEDASTKLCASTCAQMEESLSRFLQVVSRYDLSFPHEDALAVAMQMCIDRLIGLGLESEAAWELSNLAMLKFLEEIADLQESEFGKELGKDDELDLDGPANVDSIIQQIAQQTAMICNDHLGDVPGDLDERPALIVDFPEGMSFTTVSLFYDSNVSMGIPVLVIASSSGTQFLRVTTSETISGADKPEPQGTGDGSHSNASAFGASLQMFTVDGRSALGKGGLPLIALGTDVFDLTNDLSVYQRLCDIECADIEFHVSNAACADLIRLADKLSESFADQIARPKAESTRRSPSVVATALSITFIVTCENFLPFARAVLTDFRVKKCAPSELGPGLEFASNQIQLMNLSPQGDLHPVALSTLSGTEGCSLVVKLARGDGISVTLKDVQLVFLRQFLCEIMQYFTSADYELGSIFSRKKAMADHDKGLTILVEMLETSVVFPHSSSSVEMMCIETERTVLRTSFRRGSFSMPSSMSPLKIDTVEKKGEKVHRISISIGGARLFAAVNQGDHLQSNSSFRYFYELNGRAKTGKGAFRRRQGIDVAVSETVQAGVLATAENCWVSCTPSHFSLDLFVDQGSHLRILVTDPVDAPKTGFHLDLNAQIFCSLLSIWYSNMQELPVMLPYSAEQLHSWSDSPKYYRKYPQYGTEDFEKSVNRPEKFTTELLVCLDSASLECKSSNALSDSLDYNLFLLLSCTTVQMSVDELGVTRIGSGSSRVELLDKMSPADQLLLVGNELERSSSWADCYFGLDYSSEREGFGGLPQPFQLSVCMTELWTIYNLGLQSPSVTLPNLKPIFDFLSFVSNYFIEKRYGNPIFESLVQAAEWREKVRKSSSLKGDHPLECEAPAGIDFRLWTTSPQIRVPCFPLDLNSSHLGLSGDGRLLYKFIGLSGWQSQELLIDGLSLFYDDDKKETQTKSRHIDECTSTIATNISLGVRLDHNEQRNHTDVSVEMPCSRRWINLFDGRVVVKPLTTPQPTVCSPVTSFAERHLEPCVCEITLMVDIIPLVSTTILNFLGNTASDSEATSSSKSGQSPSRSPTLSCSMALSSFRIFLLDPFLERHLPLCVLTASSFDFSASNFSVAGDNQSIPEQQALPADFQLAVCSTCWVDYFKLGLTRSWEPCLESYSFSALYERSIDQVAGIHMKSGCQMHLNISSAMFTIVPNVMRILTKLTEGKTVIKGSSQSVAEPIARGLSISESVGEWGIAHEIPSSDTDPSLQPLSMRNMTGGRMRISEPTRKSKLKTSIVYLDPQDTAKLEFYPTVTRLENLRPVEVAYPGTDNNSYDNPSFTPLPPHELDIQLEGFKWIRIGRVDSVGRKFATLEAKISDVQQKVANDWQLGNVMKVLVETGLQSGGRQVTARSVFTVTNHTSRPLDLKLSPEKDNLEEGTGRDSSNIQTIPPGDCLNIPALLFVSALQNEGTCLGYSSVRPSPGSFGSHEYNVLLSGSSEPSDETLSVGYSLKPLPLYSLVEESAEVVCSGGVGIDTQIPDTTGLQCPCPVWTDSGTRLASFFFQIEIGRNVIPHGVDRNSESSHHGPVLYNIAVHAPLVISNLLSKAARFILKHAVRDVMVWSADLKPGEEAPVHTVGLDAPLLLFVNLDFAKTPAGEGALVHHGAVSSDSTRGNLMGLKSIGKAGKAVTKQLGRTLTSMGESPSQIEGPAKHRESADRHPTGYDDDDGGKLYSVEKTHFLPEEIDDGVTLVDTLGQTLVLNIENSLGKGGQRKIAVFCRFWLVNTTEHCLRYRQENYKNFVAGSVHSPIKNGSKRDRPNRGQPTSDSLPAREPDGAIYSGTPGALASSPGRCDLRPEVVSALIDKNMSFHDFAKTACMFNFFEGHVIGIGQQKLCVQLGDSTGKTNYVSDWSRGISLDSVGITQTVGIHCKDGRLLEINMVVHVAPGALANKTKIVRFLPRFVVVNNLSVPIRIWQDNSLFHAGVEGESTKGGVSTNWSSFRRRSRPGVGRVNQYENLWGRQCIFDETEDWIDPREETAARGSALFIAALSPGDVIPFSLPDSRRDRQLRVDLGRPWDLSASVSADTPGDHTLRISHAVDLQNLPHVSTRTSPQFEVTLSSASHSQFDGNIGIWFETEMDAGQHIIVKAIQRGSFCFNHTDVHLGDELLAVDQVPVSRMSFADTMLLLKRRLNEVSSVRKNQPRKTITPGREDSSSFCLSVAEEMNLDLVITFRSVEERLRLVRLKAARTSESARQRRTVCAPDFSVSGNSESRYRSVMTEEIYMRIELKNFERSDVGMFVVVDKKPPIPFRLRNQSTSTTICYRQKGCGHHPWRFLGPGCSTRYAWEEPLKPKRLSVRVALDSDGVKDRSRTTPKDEEEGVFTSPITVRLEDIGFEEVLPIPNQKTSKVVLKFSVDIVESSRVLVVTDETSDDGHLSLLRERLQCVTSEISAENSKIESLRNLSDTSANLASQISEFVRADLQPANCIHACHQLLVSIEEARGLNCGSLDGCNPYVVVKLKGCSDHRSQLFRKKDVRKSVFVKKTPNPAWRGQNFVFNITEDAVRTTRGCAVQIDVKSFRVLGRHISLGRTQIDLHCLRDQVPREGWFSLSGRSGRQELENDHSHWGRGSIKLRLHWIYSPSALLQYSILLSEQELTNKQTTKSGIERQLQELEVLEHKGGENNDHPKPLRFKELFSLSKSNMKARAAEMQKRRKPSQSVVKKLIDPLRNYEKSEAHCSSPTDCKNLNFEGRNDNMPLLLSNQHNHSKRSPDNGVRKRLNSSPGLLRGIEDQISETRQSIQRLPQSRPRFGSSQTVELESIRLPPQAFKSWSLVQAVRSYGDLELLVLDEDIKIELKNCYRNLDRSPGQSNEGCVTSNCLSLPSGSPSYLTKSALEVAQGYVKARKSASRAVNMTLKTVLHPGGWLTVRPMTALNLPEGFAKLFVEVKYGSEVLTSTSASFATMPEWSATVNEGESRNDIHLHVAPQKTSGSIRVAVVGEKKNKKLRSKVELGVVYLPLGSAIAACVGKKEDDGQTQPAAYIRWFPLKTTKDMMHSEGDAGLSTKPLEAEKLEYDMMENMFAPCLKIALVWLPDLHEAASSSSGTRTSKPSSTKVPMMQNYFTADIGSISLSLIDSVKAKELLSLNVLDMDFHYWATKAKTRFGMTAGWLQIDYQSEDSREPVVLAPTQIDQLVPVIQTLAVKDNLRSMLGVAAFDFIDISLAEFDITVEENLLLDLFSFVASIVGEARRVHGQHGFDRRATSGVSTLHDTLTTSTTNDQDMKLYIRQLFLGVLRVNLSYVKGRRSHTWKQESNNAYAPDSDFLVAWAQANEGSLRSGSGDEKQSRSIPSYLTNLLPNVSDAPIRLPGKALSHVFQRPSEILKWIRRFYTTEVLKQLYRILGSLDFVGNPTMLLTSFLSGVHDMVVAPSVALLNSPTDPSKVGLIFAQGTLSMVSYSTSGFFGTLAKVSASAGQGVAAMSLDADFREWHRNEILTDATNINRVWKKRGVQNVGRMVARPIADIVFGVTGGVVGVITSPIKGYRRNGNRGLAEGVCVGVVGLLARPMVGFLDSFSHFAGSIHDVAKSVNVLDKRVQPAKRLRLPYAFASMAILKPYDEDHARAQKLLQRFPLLSNGHLDRSQGEAIVHVEVLASTETETFIIATSHRVAVVRVIWEASGASVSSLCWQGTFSVTQNVFSIVDEYDQGHGSSLTLSRRPNRSALRQTEDDNANQRGQFELSTLRMVNFVTPKQKTGREEEEGLKNKTSEKSGLAADDHFTVLGEYRFRHQLIKIHNAICCVSQEFDKILFDPLSPDLLRRKEGSLSFGGFHFHETTAKETTNDFVLPGSMESIPWISHSVILDCQGKTANEQKLYLHALRDGWSVDNEIELADSEGGPAWLVHIRALSRFVEQDLSHPRTFQPIEGRFVPPDSTLKVRNSAPSATPLSLAPLPVESLHRYHTAHGSQWGAEEQTTLDTNQPDALATIAQRDLFDLPSAGDPTTQNRRTDKDTVLSSFASAGLDITEQLPSGINANLRLNSDALSTRSNDRLDRLESIMEQLVLFTASQYPHAPPEVPGELTELRQQVDMLRTDLDKGSVQDEMLALRNEVNNLKTELSKIKTEQPMEEEEEGGKEGIQFGEGRGSVGDAP